MPHKVNIYDIGAGFDASGWMRPVRVLETEDPAEDWLDENPIEGAWIGRMVEDPAHWAGYGVRTPEELEKYLLLTDYSELHKELTGFRPRDTGLSMSSPLADIEAAYERLRDLPADDGPEPL